MNKKVIAAVICVVVVGAVLGAYFIALPAPQIEQKQSEITITDLAGRTVTIKKPVERVVLTIPSIELIAVEGGKDPFKKIVGLDRNGGHGICRPGIWEKYKSVFPEIEEIQDVGTISKGTFSIEKVIMLNPDVVILGPYEYENKEIWEKLEQAGIPVIFVDYHAETLEKHTKSTLLLGKVLGKEERAQEIVEFYEEQVNEVYSRLEEIDNPKPKVYIEGGYKRWRVYDKTTMLGAIANRIGAINIAEEGTKEINPEQVLDANPDVIIITGSYWPKYEGSMRLGYFADPKVSRELLKQQIDRPGWDTLNAVKNNRVYSIHHGIPRHIYDFVPIQYMTKCFYPEEFEDLDPEERFIEFHERFLPVDYSGVWMLSLEE